MTRSINQHEVIILNHLAIQKDTTMDEIHRNN